LVPERNVQMGSKDKFWGEMPLLVRAAGYVARLLKEASEVCPCNSNCSSDGGFLLGLVWYPLIHMLKEARLCP